MLNKNQLKEKKPAKSFTCPHCKTVCTSAIQQQELQQEYDYDLRTGESEEYDSYGIEHVDWKCPECSEILPFDICVQIEDILGW